MRVSEQLLGTPRAPTKYPGEQEQQGADGGDPEVDILGVSASGTGDGQQTVTGPGSTPADRFLLLSARWLVVQLPWPCRARAVNRLTARRYFLHRQVAGGGGQWHRLVLRAAWSRSAGLRWRPVAGRGASCVSTGVSRDLNSRPNHGNHDHDRTRGLRASTRLHDGCWPSRRLAESITRKDGSRHCCRQRTLIEQCLQACPAVPLVGQEHLQPSLPGVLRAHPLRHNSPEAPGSSEVHKHLDPARNLCVMEDRCVGQDRPAQGVMALLQRSTVPDVSARREGGGGHEPQPPRCDVARRGERPPGPPVQRFVRRLACGAAPARRCPDSRARRQPSRRRQREGRPASSSTQRGP